MPRRAVFLDRDGVLNRSLIINGKPFAPRCLEDFVIFDDVDKALEKLKSKGFYLIVATNQPDVGNGFVSQIVVEAMHSILRAKLPIDDIEVCYASQNDGSFRRKPEPGMLFDAASKWEIELSTSFMIGDRAGDIEAGRRAGCRTVFLDRGYEEKKPLSPDYIATSLGSATEIIARIA